MGVYNLYPGEMQHRHCAHPSCCGLHVGPLGSAKPVEGQQAVRVEPEESGSVFAQHLALWHPIAVSNSLLLCSPFLARCLQDSGDVALACWDLADRVQSGRAPASWDECSLPRVQPE